MLEFFTHLFDSSGFPPRWHCGEWSEAHGWLHILSDLAVFGAYFAIPVSLSYYVRTKKHEVAFPKLYLLFALFILSCGVTHLIEATIFWQPWYRLSGFMKAVTAVVSWATVIMLIKVMPQAMHLPGVMALNRKLREEVEERKKSEAALRESSARLSVAIEEREKLLRSEGAARAEAELANRMKDDFLATLSHELRTPLNAILSWCHLLREDTAVPEEMHAGLDIIERNSRTQVRLIEDLLDMSRIVSGKVRLDVQSVQLPSVIAAAVDTLMPVAAKKKVQLTQVLDPLAGPVMGDPSRLQQVVWNLLANAIKFTPEGGRVAVALERVNSHVEITVTDSGIGIAPELLPVVFDRFLQADSSITRRHGGLGLGLSIAKNLVELHGGSISAKSPGLGQGATFRVQLPLSVVDSGNGSKRAHPLASQDSPEADITNLQGLKILAVDDEADALDAVRRLLEARGAAVVTARSGPEALELLQRAAFHVLISDLGMPEMDGLTFLKTVRQLPGHPGRIPAVAMTAFARSEDRQRAMHAGFDTFISKPVAPLELFAVVARHGARGSAT